MRTIPEADWKVFREVQPRALDRFCRRVLDQIGQITGDARQSNHER